MDPKWRTFAVLLILLAGASAAIALLGGGGSSGAPIEVAQAPAANGGVEVLITVSEEINVPDTAGGEELVMLVCTDESGTAVVRSQQTWPLLKDGDPPAPHAHQPVTEEEVRSISECRLEGTEPELSGEMGLAR